MNWQPIETAPKDGTDLLGYEYGFGVMCIYFTPRGECYMPFADDVGIKPTHWMPLPEPPK